MAQKESQYLQGLGYWERLNLLVFGGACAHYEGRTLRSHLAATASKEGTKRSPSRSLIEHAIEALQEEFGCPTDNWAYLSILPEASGPVVSTSMGVKMPLLKVIPALRAYRAGRLQRGDSVGGYTVMSVVDGESLSVGCHKFHPTHLDFFYDLVKESYPSLLTKQSGGTR